MVVWFRKERGIQINAAVEETGSDVQIRKVPGVLMGDGGIETVVEVHNSKNCW